MSVVFEGKLRAMFNIYMYFQSLHWNDSYNGILFQ